jgi:hypothetical protein
MNQTVTRRRRWIGPAILLALFVGWLMVRTLLIEAVRSFRWGPLTVGIVMQVLFSVALTYGLLVFGSKPNAIQFDFQRRILVQQRLGRLAKAEGRQGNKLVAVGRFRAYFVKTNESWEARYLEFATDKRLSCALTDGWQIVSLQRRFLGIPTGAYLIRLVDKHG